MKRLVILGAGTAGTMMANKFVATLSAKEWQITVIDRDDDHIYQPGLLFVPFGIYRPDEIVRPRKAQLHPSIQFVLDEVEAVDPNKKSVTLAKGEVISYDLLIIATGTRVRPEKTEGLTGEGWKKDAFDFYTFEGSSALAKRLDGFNKGKLIVDTFDMPIKCPVAPLEFILLADAFFTERGVRDDIELVFATPLDGAFTKPVASSVLGDMLSSRGIEIVTNFNTESVDGSARKVSSYDGRALDYDLLVTIPLHGGSEAIVKSGFGDPLGFVPTHKHTLQSEVSPDIFVIGDATNVPASKAGAVAHFQGEVLFENILRYLKGLPPLPEFDGHANCFIETGHGKAMLIDFNYNTQPLTGKFPLPGIGPFSLLKESEINHWGKLAFRWAYWNILLPGKELPLDHRMLMTGKWSA